MIEELIEKYQDWLDTSEKDDWTTINLCIEVIEDLRDLARG